MKIQIERQLTKSLYVKINAAIYFSGWVFRFWIIFSLALGICIFLLYGRTSLSIVAAAAAFILVMVIVMSLPAIKVMANLVSPQNRRYFLPSTLIFDESGMSATSATGEGKRKWSAFTGWRKVSGCYLLYLSKAKFVAVPQSSIAPQDIPAFESLLTDKIMRSK